MVRNVVLNAPEQALSVQLCCMLALLTKNRALDNVQAPGEGEGLAAWRGLEEQWEPKSRSRFTSMLLSILNGRRHRVVGAGHPELREADQLRHPRFCEGWHPH